MKRWLEGSHQSEDDQVDDNDVDDAVVSSELGVVKCAEVAHAKKYTSASPREYKVFLIII